MKLRFEILSYGAFYDIPRQIFCVCQNQKFAFNCEFWRRIDDYCGHYTVVYDGPAEEKPENPMSHYWCSEKLRDVPIKHLVFDPTRRRYFDIDDEAAAAEFERFFASLGPSTDGSSDAI